MTQHRFQVAELSLGFQLPLDFWRPYEKNQERIGAILTNEGESLVCSTPQELLDMQEAATESALCVVESMVDWWDKFFVIGETGDGGIFLMKREGSAAVWIMDSNWYDEPYEVSTSFEDFLDQLESGDLPE